ncbi:MAG: hypothetical protein J5616_02330 [Bacteroidaceae bacterium]|nr:hypothetical protein [Bacteroidaceae bacterium]
MKKNYYRIAIERYFSTPVPYFLIGTVPLMLYGYYESDLWFWVGMVLTLAVFAVNHFLMHSLTRAFGLYATKRQVDYVSHFCVSKDDVFSEQEVHTLMSMIADQSDNAKISIEDYINYINHQLEEKSNKGNAEATYWLAMYHRLLGETDNHNVVARELIEKSANMGSERAKKLQKRAQKWV